MTQRIRISDNLTVATGQPTQEELEQLSQEGFRAVVNLRTAGEQNQALSPEAEGEVARAAGLGYAHIPVSPTGPQPGQVDAFRERLAELPGPVLVHCASGKRSGALAILHAASQQGLSGEDALAKARALGFNWQSPELEDFVRRYLDRQP
jgi:uncharacterized protein (TIGR01244 family)